MTEPFPAVKDELKIRGATLLRPMWSALYGSLLAPGQVTPVSALGHTLSYYDKIAAFLPTLSGPFDELRSIRIPAPRTLCKCLIIFTPASTVYIGVLYPPIGTLSR